MRTIREIFARIGVYTLSAALGVLRGGGRVNSLPRTRPASHWPSARADWARRTYTSGWL